MTECKAHRGWTADLIASQRADKRWRDNINRTVGRGKNKALREIARRLRDRGMFLGAAFENYGDCRICKFTSFFRYNIEYLWSYEYRSVAQWESTKVPEAVGSSPAGATNLVATSTN